MMDDIPSFGDMDMESDSKESADSEFDDSLLDEAYNEIDSFELEQEVDGPVDSKNTDFESTKEEPSAEEELSADASSPLDKEENVTPEPDLIEDDSDDLSDMPGLDDWLSSSKEEIEEADTTDFDEMLESLELESPLDEDVEPSLGDTEENSEPEAEQSNAVHSTSEADLLNDTEESELSDDEPEFSLDESDAEDVDSTDTSDDSELDDSGDFELDDDDIDDDLEAFFELDNEDEDDSEFAIEDDSELDDLDIPGDIDLDIASPQDIEGNVEEDKKRQSADESLQLDNPDLDLEALLSDVGDSVTPNEANLLPEDFLDVEALMDDGDDIDNGNLDNQELDLDVSLSDFTGVSDDDTVIDIDKDAGQNANLDLARAYIEMDDVNAARELLEEVLELGNEEQKAEADAILKSIG